MKKNVLGVKVDDINMDQAMEVIEGWLKKPGKYFIATPNPEFIVAAQADSQFKEILNKADLAIPDGAGLKLAGLKNTVSGTDLMKKLIALSVENGYLISLLGGREGVAEKLKERLEQTYKQSFPPDKSGRQTISIKFAGSEGKIDNQGEQISGRKIKIPPSDILFVGFGHGKQEKWIYKNFKNTPAKIQMGVGGAFDFFIGAVPRAPVWVRRLGFEWLFRLTVQPWRIKRQLSLIKYLWLLVT